MSETQPHSDNLAAINELGRQIADLFAGHSAIVVINLAGSLFAGAGKVGKLTRGQMHDLLDRFLDSDDGLTADIRKPN